jgi:hypothetical protein
MSSSNSNKTVRFSASAVTVSRKIKSPDNKVTNITGDSFVRGPLKKRKLEKDDSDRMNEDELDDVDDWKPDDDANDKDDAAALTKLTERDLREAKRERRTKRVFGVGGDVDDDPEGSRENSVLSENRTSLAAEGIKIEPFNMDQERSDGSGYFDGDTYVFRKRDGDDDEVDAWVDSLGEQQDGGSAEGKNDDEDIQHSRLAMKREDLLRKQRADTIDERIDNWSEDDLYHKLLPYLVANETVMAALIRYGNFFQTKKSAKKVSDVEGESATFNDEGRRTAQDSFNVMTEAANALLLKGNIDIYQMKRIDIEELIKPKQLLDGASTVTVGPVKSDQVRWEYQGNQDGHIHGPFSTEEMLGWTRAGYFVGSTAVQVRIVRQPPLEGKSIQEDLLHDLLSDDEEHNENQSTPSRLEREEWKLSDTVDFLKYLT